MKIKTSVFCIVLLVNVWFVGQARCHEPRIPTPSVIKTGEGTPIKVSSYNIRVAAAADVETGNAWEIRKVPLADLMLRHDFDIIGTQEGSFKQMDELMALLPGYGYIGYPYAGKNANAHTASIVYKKDKFDIVDQGVFWYSETPDTLSIGWDATDTRICSWAKIKHKTTGQQFYFFTSHFYWKHRTAKLNSGQLMVDKIKEITTDEQLPIISTGDLNSRPNTTQIKDILTLLKDSYHNTETPRSGPEGTGFPGGVFEGTPGGRIDYILVNDFVKVQSYSVIDDTYGKNRYPSDHLPVVCDLVLKNKKLK